MTGGLKRRAAKAAPGVKAQEPPTPRRRCGDEAGAPLAERARHSPSPVPHGVRPVPTRGA